MEEVPETGAVFTFGRSRFGDDNANKFWVKNDPIIKIACGDEHTAVVTSTGRVFTFGSNQWGQLALGNLDKTNKPSFVRSLKGVPIKEISCGRSHTLFASDEDVYGCGSNGDNQVYAGEEHTITKPYLIPSLSRISVIKLSCGVEHSLALTKRGELYMWGSGAEGQLGMGKSVKQLLNPSKLKFVDEQIKDADCGYYHTGFVTRSGKAYTFGESEGGKLGLGEELEETYHTPQVVFLVDEAVSISCGNTCSAIRTSNGALYMAGDGQRGQLGFSPKSLDRCVYTFTKVPCTPIKYVAVGESHTAVISRHGQLYTFGDGRHGKLCMGDENFNSLTSPQLVHTFNGVATVIDVSCGGCHTMVVAKPVNPQDAAPESPPKHPVTAPLQVATPEVKSYARMKRQRLKGENKENEGNIPAINSIQIKTVESSPLQPKDKKVKFIDTHFDESGTKEHDKKTDSKLKEKNKRQNKVEEKNMEKEEDSGSETDEPGESSEEDSEEEDDDDSIDKRFSENIMSFEELPEITPARTKLVEATPTTPVKTIQTTVTPSKYQSSDKVAVAVNKKPQKQPEPIEEDSDSFVTVSEDEDESEDEEEEEKKTEEVKTLVSQTPKDDTAHGHTVPSKEENGHTVPSKEQSEQKTDKEKEPESKPSRFAFWKKKKNKKKEDDSSQPATTTTTPSDESTKPTLEKGTHQSSKACIIL